MIESYKVPKIKIPTWPELSVAKLLPVVMEDPILKKYFPDKYAKGKVPDRNYFWGVICAIKPLSITRWSKAQRCMRTSKRRRKSSRLRTIFLSKCLMLRIG